jgi:allene oxide cyclase
MKRVLAAGILACILAVLVAAVAASGRQSDRAQPGPGTSITIIEHAVTDSTTDTGPRGDSTGDLLTFHNVVYDASDSNAVGTDQGECVRIDPAGGTWECRWITILDGGTIAVEGQFLDTANTTLAITGGTGSYSKARGEMELVSRNGGTEYDFIYHLH